MSDICQPVNIITEYPSEPVQFMELERNMGENKPSLIQKLLVSLPFSRSLSLFPFSAFLFFFFFFFFFIPQTPVSGQRRHVTPPRPSGHQDLRELPGSSGSSRRSKS